LIWSVKSNNGPTTSRRCFAYAFIKNHGWGSPLFAKYSEIEEDAKRYKSEQEKIVYVDEGLKPTHITYKISGTITYRLIPGYIWSDVSKDMIEKPAHYLYLTEDDQLYPEKPAMITLKSRAEYILSNPIDSIGCFTTFIVGESETVFRVDDICIKQLIEVPLAYEGMSEGSSKTVKLPCDDVESFKVLHRFLVTLEVSQSDMQDNVYCLMEFANKYQIKMLHYMCEYYLCWRVQNTYVDVNISETLKVSVECNALTLKKACYEVIYTYGLTLLSAPDFDFLAEDGTALEMLRYFAMKRESHMPELSSKKIPEKKEPKRISGPPPPQPALQSQPEPQQIQQQQPQPQQPQPQPQQVVQPLHLQPQPQPQPPPQQLPPPSLNDTVALLRARVASSTADIEETNHLITQVTEMTADDEAPTHGRRRGNVSRGGGSYAKKPRGG
jgi:hypothetical protein